MEFLVRLAIDRVFRIFVAQSFGFGVWRFPEIDTIRFKAVGTSKPHTEKK